MKKLAVLLVVCCGSVALAGLGPAVAPSEGFHQVCLLDFGRSAERYTEVCTGILINPWTVVTAAHCVRPDAPHTITCGPRSRAASFDAAEIRVHPGYRTRVLIEDISHQVKDIAVIPLKSPLPAQEIPLVAFPEADPASLGRCAFFGFSKVSMQARTEPVEPRFGWRVDPLNFEWAPGGHGLLRVRGLLSPGALLEVGDSGGPLMCERGGQWRLLGIASSRDFRYHSNFVAAVDPEFSLVGAPPVTSAQAAQARQEGAEFRLKALRDEFATLLRDVGRMREFIEIGADEQAFLQELFRPGAPEAAARATEGRRRLDALRRRIQGQLAVLPGVVLRLKEFSSVKIRGESSPRSIGDLIYNYFQVESIDLESGTAVGRLRTLGVSDYFICRDSQILCGEDNLSNVEIRLEDLVLYFSRASVF